MKSNPYDSLPEDVQKDIFELENTHKELEKETEEHHVLISDIVKKELKRCRFKDTDKNVLKISARYKVDRIVTKNKATKIIHSLIMTNTSILEK
jgi:hypothetical protein